MRIGAVEILCVVTVISCLVAGTAVCFVFLRCRDPDSGKAHVLDILKLLRQTGPVAALIIMKISRTVLLIECPVVAGIAVKEAIRHKHVNGIVFFEILRGIAHLICPLLIKRCAARVRCSGTEDGHAKRGDQKQREYGFFVFLHNAAPFVDDYPLIAPAAIPFTIFFCMKM